MCNWKHQNNFLFTEDSGGKEDEERRTSSSNASEEFEKINVQDLENQDKAEDDELVTSVLLLFNT